MGSFENGDLPDSRKSLKAIFEELDTDSSGNISKDELILAMKKVYGKPLKTEVIDQMMLEADADNDGEISFVEFEMLMEACAQDAAASKSSSKKKTLWTNIRDRGLTASRELKTSEDMRLRRVTSREKLQQKIEKLVSEAITWDVKFFPPPRLPNPWPLPSGGGHPPRGRQTLQDGGWEPDPP